MDKRSVKNLIICGSMFIVFIIFTIIVKFVDVSAVGEAGSIVGLSGVNGWFHNLVGYNSFWFKFTEILGLISFVVAGIIALIGLIQLIKRKSIKKVDKEIIFSGGLYVFIGIIFLFFEFVVINNRPVLMDGVLEASYPSTHTLLATAILGSAGILFSRLIKNKKCLLVIESFLGLILLVVVVGRLISGVHWLTDIIGGLILGSALVMLYYSVNNIHMKKSGKRSKKVL